MTEIEALAGGLPGLGTELAALADRLRESVVLIRGRGSGSGVIWQADGLIVTNDHVMVEDEGEVVLADGRTMAAQVVARDPRADLAALRVAAIGLPAVETRAASGLRVGEIVLAVGNPYGLRGAVTAGIVSATGRRLWFGGREWRDVVQADVRLRPGNSGGPLADAAGRVVGINAMVVPPRVALAVPAEAVAGFLEQSGGRRPYLGIEGTIVPVPAGAAGAFGGGLGVVLSAVQPGSPAERAGLLVGDVLVGLDGAPLRLPSGLAERLRSSSAAPLRLAIVRGGVRREVTVRPAAA